MEIRTKVTESALKADRLTIFNVPAVVSRLYAAHNDQKYGIAVKLRASATVMRLV